LLEVVVVQQELVLVALVVADILKVQWLYQFQQFIQSPLVLAVLPALRQIH
jgi:hypothetical protein